MSLFDVGGDVGGLGTTRALAKPHETTRPTARLSMNPHETTWNFVSGSELLIRRSRVRDPPGSLVAQRLSSPVRTTCASMSGEMSGDGLPK
jgi:hypothetical protein